MQSDRMEFKGIKKYLRKLLCKLDSHEWIFEKVKMLDIRKNKKNGILDTKAYRYCNYCRKSKELSEINKWYNETEF